MNTEISTDWKERLIESLEATREWLSAHRKDIQKTVIAVHIASFILLGIWLGYTYHYYAAVLHSQLASHSLKIPSGIYAAPRHISAGREITQEKFSDLLVRAGYQEGEQENEFSAGNFIVHSNTVEIITNQFSRNNNLPARTRLTFDEKRIVAIKNLDTGQKLKEIRLPPELLTADLNAKKQVRSATSFEDLPQVLVNAVCAIEDRNFFSHDGVDFKAIARAFYKNLSEGEIREGASTITQQLIKNEFLSSERTYERKFAEALMAIALEQRLNKQQILALYCDRIYLGHSGITSVYGFKQAASVYFGKELDELSLSEAAFLAGMIKAPNRYSPYTNLDQAIERRDCVIAAMVEQGSISSDEAERARNETPVFMLQQKLGTTAAPHFIDYVNRELDSQKIDADIRKSQLRIRTSVDLDLQESANEVVAKHLNNISKFYKKRSSQPEAALVALDPQTGEVLAMVGGRDYTTSQLNRVTDARRQPGSVFKPVIYATALSEGVSPLTRFMNEPHEIRFGYKEVYNPQNFGNSYSYRPVTLREAIVRSLNVVSVDAAMRVGLGNVAQMAAKMGLEQTHAYPSMALGTSEASPLEIARAYTTFANDRMRVDPMAIYDIEANGETIFTGYSRRISVLSSQAAFVVTDTLTDVVNRGTAARIRRLGYSGPAAGKTGTSRDAWFVGYTPNLLVVVWVGFDDNQDLGMTGGEAAVPIWADFVNRALEVRPDLSAAGFSRPAGLDSVEIDPDTGMIADEYCPRRQKVLLPSYLRPGLCFEHQAPLVTTNYDLLPDDDASLDEKLEWLDEITVEDETKDTEPVWFSKNESRKPDDKRLPKQKPK